MRTVKHKKLLIMVLTIVLLVATMTTAAFADGEYGKNTYDWIQSQVWWIALAVIAVMAVKFAIKKMWVQFGGFLLLGAIVLVVVKYPEKLLTIGNLIWTKIFG